MGSVKRRSRNQPTSVDALSARLPEELKSFGLRTDMPARTAEITKWINAQTPGMGADLVQPVMGEVGLTYMFSLRDQLTAKPTGTLTVGEFSPPEPAQCTPPQETSQTVPGVTTPDKTR